VEGRPKPFYCAASAAIMGISKGHKYMFFKKEKKMGERGSKKDKNKADKQKQEQLEKKKEQQKAKLPAKKPA
jgi:hypothetical protein